MFNRVSVVFWHLDPFKYSNVHSNESNIQMTFWSLNPKMTFWPLNPNISLRRLNVVASGLTRTLPTSHQLRLKVGV